MRSVDNGGALAGSRRGAARNGRVQAVARLGVHEGKLAALEALAARAAALVEEAEPGTTAFDWYVSDDGKTCVTMETHESPEAALIHFANLGPLAGEIAQVCTPLRVELFGEITDDVRRAVGPLADVVVFRPLLGQSRRTESHEGMSHDG